MFIRPFRGTLIRLKAADLPIRERDFKKTDSLIVYRGADSKGHALRGLSWSTDRKQAIWFARRFAPGQPWLAKAQVTRQHIAARFLRRGEEEVILKAVPRNATAQAL